MGDRTWLDLEFHSRDLNDAVVKRLDEEGVCIEAMDLETRIIALTFDEVNYGGTGFLEDLSNLGLPFIYEHGAGGSYAPCRGCCWGGKIYEFETSHDGIGTCKIRINKQGDLVIDVNTLANIRETLLMMQDIRKYWEKGGNNG